MITDASIIRIRCATLLLAGVVLLLVAGTTAMAVDGNYVSPYASQYATRSTAAAIPNETWLGMLLVIVTVLAGSFYTLRYRIRERRPA